MFTKNSKIKPTRHRLALENMVQSGVITNNTKLDRDRFVDQCDQLVRLSMAMFRECVKPEPETKDNRHKTRVLENLDKLGQRRIQLVLDKIMLPEGYCYYEADPAEASPLPIFQASSPAAKTARGTPNLGGSGHLVLRLMSLTL